MTLKMCTKTKIALQTLQTLQLADFRTDQLERTPFGLSSDQPQLSCDRPPPACLCINQSCNVKCSWDTCTVQINQEAFLLLTHL